MPPGRRDPAAHGTGDQLRSREEEGVLIEEILKPDAHGCPGDGTAIDPDAWERLLTEAVAEGKRIVFSGTYDLRRVRTFAVSGAMRMGAERPGEAILKGGPDGLHMLDLRSGELVFCGIRTDNIAVVHGPKAASRMTGPVDRIELLDWTWRNRTVPAFALARHYPKAAPPGDTVIGRLTIGDVHGRGGTGGISVVAPIARVDIDDLAISGIRVPDDERHFHKRGDGRRAMTNIGCGEGLRLGEDTAEAAKIEASGRIDNVLVRSVSDFRNPEGLDDDCLASVDGIRITVPNLQIGRVRVRSVWSRQGRDTTGAYFKCRGGRVADLDVLDCGGHEGSVVIKGGGDGKAPGNDFAIDRLSIDGSGDTRRAALYLGTDNIRLGQVRIRGMGGDLTGLDLPPDSDAYGPLVHMQRVDDKGSIEIGSLRITDCSIHRDAESAAVMVQGYRSVDIGELRIEGLAAFSRDGRREARAVGVMLGSRHDVAGVSIDSFSMTGARGQAAVAFKQTGSQEGRVGDITFGRMRLDQTVRRGLWFVGGQSAGSCRIEALEGMAAEDCLHPDSDAAALPRRVEIAPPQDHDPASDTS